MIQLIKNLNNRLNNILGKAVIRLIQQSPDYGKIFVQVTGKADDIKSDVEHLCQYGFRSVPLKGAKGIWVAYGGDTDNMSVIVADDKTYGRFPLQEGDTMIYNQNGTRTIYSGDTVISTIAEGGTWQVDLGSNQIKLSDDGFFITIDGATYNFGDMLAEFSKSLEVDGDIDSTGTITGDVDVIGGGKSLKTHVHAGVQSGGSQTSPPV